MIFVFLAALLISPSQGPIAGGTVYHLADRMDAGAIAAQEWCFVRKGETARELWERALAPLGQKLLAEVIDYVKAHNALPAKPQDEPSIPVELAGTTRMLPRSSVRWVEAQGDYARLHTVDASHLVRVSLATLAERWADAGFVRIHRSYLVQLRLVAELRLTQSGYVVAIDGVALPVSRRHTRELKDKLIRAAKHDWTR